MWKISKCHRSQHIWCTSCSLACHESSFFFKVMITILFCFVFIFPDAESSCLCSLFYYCLRNLEVLTLGRGQLADNFFHALADCHLLKSLTVNDSTLVNVTQEIPISHDRLRHLHLTKCRVIRISVRLVLSIYLNAKCI